MKKLLFGMLSIPANLGIALAAEGNQPQLPSEILETIKHFSHELDITFTCPTWDQLKNETLWKRNESGKYELRNMDQKMMYITNRNPSDFKNSTGNFMDGRLIFNVSNSFVHHVTELSCRYAGEGQGDLITINPVPIGMDGPVDLSKYSVRVDTIGGQNHVNNFGNETRIFAGISGNPQSVMYEISRSY